MPIKNVYGKKGKKSTAFVSSKAFRWSSSPGKPVTHVGKVDEVALALSTLSIDETETRPQTPPRERPALKARDSNAVVKPRLSPDIRERSPGQKAAIRQSPRLAAKRREATDGSRREPELSPTRHNAPPETQRKEALHTSKRSPKFDRHDSLLDSDSDEHPHVRSLLNLVTDAERRRAPVPFHQWTNDLDEDFTIIKIAEASYAQVYLLSRKVPTGITNDDQSILKIISLNPPSQHLSASAVDLRPQKVKGTSSEVEKVVSEVRLLDRMTEIPGFTNLREVRVLQGQPTSSFVTAWREWNKSRLKKDKSLFPDPSRKSNYGEDQLWAIVEMDHAGLDLEHPSVKIDSLWSLWDVFWGVAIALAKGEEDVKFEHRDLHLGNICVTQTREDDSFESPRVQNVDRKLGFTGLETTIIDYTLSRAEVASNTRVEPEVVYIDLAKEEIFDGDASENYQYEIYRYMRNLVFLDKPLEDYKRGLAKVERSNKSWKGSHLRTNLLWLHFFLHELYLKIPSYFGTMNNSPDRELANNRHATIEHAFRAIDARLSLKDFHKNGLGSVRDLVLWALEEGWLDPEDVSGNQTSVEELEARMRNLGIARGNESIVADSGEDPTREKDKRRRTRVRLKS